MKRLSIILLLLVQATAVFAQRELRFNENSEFKIVQFTDLHYDAGKPESRIVISRMNEVLEAEKPDLVIVTGDLIYSSPARKALNDVIRCISSHGAPFCTVFGNHDADFDMDKGAMYDLIRRHDGCVMPARGDVPSPDYALRIMSPDGRSAAAVLYLIDSNAHLFGSEGNFIGYDFIHEEQVEWYRRTSSAFAQENEGRPLPSLAFFHIPLPEYHDAVKNERCTMIGTRMEPACSPEYNSGIFDAFKQSGDVMAVFAGHDHDNDYAVMFNDILLAYGRYTGGNTEYNNLPNGARVIILKEGRRAFESYVRLKGGQVLNRFSFPEDFIQKPWIDRPLDPECQQ